MLADVMKLSIITINYNKVEGLRKTIVSVVTQTWKDFEWIIVDGGSKDGSRELIEEYASKGCFEWWCSEKDSGIYNAMNKGLKYATGDYLLFLNSGDCFHNSKVLEKVFEKKQYESSIVYGSANYVSENSSEIKTYPYPMNLDFFIRGCTINHQSTFIKRDYQISHLYDETYKICADLKFFMQAQLDGVSFERIDLVISDFYTDGVSQRQKEIVWRENLKTYQNLMVKKFFPNSFQTLIVSYYKRRTYKRIIDWIAFLLAKCK